MRRYAARVSVGDGLAHSRRYGVGAPDGCCAPVCRLKAVPTPLRRISPHLGLRQLPGQLRRLRRHCLPDGMLAGCAEEALTRGSLYLNDRSAWAPDTPTN